MPQDEHRTTRTPFQIAVRVLVALLLGLVLIQVGYLAIALGDDVWKLTLTSMLRGEERVLQPAELRGPPLRTADTLYVLTTQQERVVPLRFVGRRLGSASPRDYTHVDLWAFDVAKGAPGWRRRVRTFEGGGLITFAILGLDGGTLWLSIREPLAVAVTDGTIVADSARLEDLNPDFKGKRVDDPGYVAFGGQGLQVTLSDATQWVVDGGTLRAARREVAPKDRPGVVAPSETRSTSRFQMRGLAIGTTRWLGVLTDKEAERLQAPPVVPGRDPNERPGVMDDFLASIHVPGDLTVQPVAYRLWGAKVTKVSAAPKEWPKDWPDKWGTRDEFSDYAALPEGPTFLQAGLLGDGRSDHPYWVRDPDSVLVLHHDKIGSAGRLKVTRIAGPGGRVVWDAALTLDELESVTIGPGKVAFVGTEPNPHYVPTDETTREEHEKIVILDVASGNAAIYDLTASSVLPDAPKPRE